MTCSLKTKLKKVQSKDRFVILREAHMTKDKTSSHILGSRA